MPAGIQQLRLGTSFGWLIIIPPPGSRRKTHQYAFRPTARLQPEQRPPVMDQVEFHIPAPPDLLPLHLPLSVRHVLSLFNDGHIRRKKSIAVGLLESEQLLGLRIVCRPEMILENTTNAPHLIPPVLIDKVFVAPLFVGRISHPAERLHRIPESPVKMTGVL